MFEAFLLSSSSPRCRRRRRRHSWRWLNAAFSAVKRNVVMAQVPPLLQMESENGGTTIPHCIVNNI